MEIYDVVQVEDKRTQDGELYFNQFPPLRGFRGNYGVPRRLNGKVAKGFFYSDTTTLDTLEILHDNYVAELQKSIPVTPTSVVRDGNLFYLTQPFLDGLTFEAMLKQQCSSEEKTEAFKTILSQALQAVTATDKVMGIDGKPENWMYAGEWTYIDTFPPFLIDGENNFGKIFNLRDFEKEFSRNPGRTYFRNPAKIVRRLWLKSEKFDHSLDYKAASMEVVRDEGLPRSVEKIVGALQ